MANDWTFGEVILNQINKQAELDAAKEQFNKQMQFQQRKLDVENTQFAQSFKEQQRMNTETIRNNTFTQGIAERSIKVSENADARAAKDLEDRMRLVNLHDLDPNLPNFQVRNEWADEYMKMFNDKAYQGAMLENQRNAPVALRKISDKNFYQTITMKDYLNGLSKGIYKDDYYAVPQGAIPQEQPRSIYDTITDSDFSGSKTPSASAFDFTNQRFSTDWQGVKEVGSTFFEPFGIIKVGTKAYNTMFKPDADISGNTPTSTILSDIESSKKAVAELKASPNNVIAQGILNNNANTLLEAATLSEQNKIKLSPEDKRFVANMKVLFQSLSQRSAQETQK